MRSFFGMTRITNPKLFWFAATLVGIAVVIQFLASGAGDKVWFFYASHSWLAGKKLYVDIFEINPPLFIWICGPASALATALHISNDLYVLIAQTLACVVLSVALCMRLLIFHPAFSETQRRLEFPMLMGLVLIASTSPVYFADRDYLFFLLVLPYVLRWLPALTDKPLPRSLGVAIGILAGIGFCIKPHCLIVFVAIQCLAIHR